MGVSGLGLNFFSTPYLLFSVFEYIPLVSRAQKISGVCDLSRHALKIWSYDSSLSSYDQRQPIQKQSVKL